MAEYELGQDEYVVLRTKEVRRDKGVSLSLPGKGELMLTNQNVVLLRKGLTGKTKDFTCYPLSSIRVIDGRPQARLDTSTFMEVHLELALDSGIVTFVFGDLEAKQQVREWIDAIWRLLVGEGAPADALGKSKLASVLEGDAITNAFDRLMDRVGDAVEREIDSETPEVATRCPSCDASLKGRPGQTIACPYCGTYVTIPTGRP